MTNKEELFFKYHNHGIDLKQAGDYRGAIQNLEKALTYFQEPDTCNALGKNYFIVGEYQKSIASFTDGFIIEYRRWLRNPGDNPNPKFAASMNHYGYAYVASIGKLNTGDKIYYLSKIDPYNRRTYWSQLTRYSMTELEHNEAALIRTGFNYCKLVCEQLNLPSIEKYFRIG